VKGKRFRIAIKKSIQNLTFFVSTIKHRNEPMLANEEEGMAKSPNTVRIRELNDAFRQTFIGGRVMMTAGVQAMPERGRAELLTKVRTFNSFEHANDPHAEHDFGCVEISGEKFFWKIDYYDPTLKFGSDNPADPTKTRRVLTIMRADEY
jgi:hypothetical protein